jgi:hypothetical protein
VTQLPLIRDVEGIPLEPLPPDKPKRRRNRERGASGKPFPRRTLHIKVQGRGCNSGPGMCLAFRCIENLSMEVTLAGSIHVPATPGRCAELSIPVERDSEHDVQWQGEQAHLGPGPWPVTWTADRQLTFAVVTRTLWLVRTWGSNCVRDLKGLTQKQVGQVLGLTKQRVDQLEQSGKAAIKGSTTLDQDGNRVPWARAILGEYAEEPRAAGFVPLMRVGRRG